MQQETAIGRCFDSVLIYYGAAALIQASIAQVLQSMLIVLLDLVVMLSASSRRHSPCSSAISRQHLQTRIIPTYEHASVAAMTASRTAATTRKALKGHFRLVLRMGPETLGTMQSGDRAGTIIDLQ